MTLHYAHHPFASASLPLSIASKNRSNLQARAVALVLAASLLVACGDDGTEGLSSCPDGKIELDKNNVLRCAPMTRAGSGAATRGGAAGAKSAATTQASTATKPAASSGASNSGAGAKPAAMSGEASKPENEGSNPPASGNNSAGNATPAPPASSGTPAAMGGGNTPVVPNGPWSCLQVGDVCSCVPSEGLGDSCTKPRPTCCTFVAMNGKAVACVCAPEGSAQCTGMKADSVNYPSAAKCPP